MKHSLSSTRTQARHHKQQQQPPNEPSPKQQEDVKTPTATANNLTVSERNHQRQKTFKSTSKTAKLQKLLASRIAKERKVAAQAASTASTPEPTAPGPISKFGTEVYLSLKSRLDPLITPTNAPTISPELPPIHGYGYSQNVIRWSQGLTLTALTAAGIASQQGRVQEDNNSSQSTLLQQEGSLPPNLILTETVMDEWVSVWQRTSDGCLLYLLGTTHRKPRSMEMAHQLVEDVRPKAVFVELDVARIQSHMLQLPGPLPTSVVGVSGGGGSTTSHTAAAATTTTTNTHSETITWVFPKTPSRFEQAWQRIIQGTRTPSPHFERQTLACDSTKVDPTAPPMINEFYYAIRAGQRHGAAIVLGDQAYSVTKSRRRLAVGLEILNMIVDTFQEEKNTKRNALAELVENDDVDGVESDSFSLDRIDGTRQQTRTALGLIKEVNPAIHRAIIEERDTCLAVNLHALNEFETIVAVVGKMHMDGIEEQLEQFGWKPVALPKRELDDEEEEEEEEDDDSLVEKSTETDAKKN